MADETQVRPTGPDSAKPADAAAPQMAQPARQAGPGATLPPETRVEPDEAPPAGAVREDSTGADREPLRGEAATRPTRDPSVPAPKPRRLKVGEQYVINYPRKAPVSLATIKVLTNEPGRHVGVEFEQPIGQFADNGNCYGTCRPGCGLWVHPQHLLSKEEHEALVAKGDSVPVRLVKQVEELEFDEEGNIRPVGADVTTGAELNNHPGAEPYSLREADRQAAKQAMLDAAEVGNVTGAPAPQDQPAPAPQDQPARQPI